MPRPSWAQVPQAVMSSVMLLQESKGPPKLCLTCDIFHTDFTAKCYNGKVPQLLLLTQMKQKTKQNNTKKCACI